MANENSKNPFIIGLIVLVSAIVVVHLLYVGYIIPSANAALAINGSAGARNFFVIIKDLEQEVCFIAMIWCSYFIITKSTALFNDRFLFKVDFLSDQDKNGDIDLKEALNKLEESEFKDKPVFQTWIACIRRFIHTEDVQNASDAIQASVESLAVRLEAENSMIRYLIWAIPSIGFIGTVRGIGQALAQADKALAGDISGMTDSLGVAFNSTLVALFISIVLMFLLHQLQRLQDGLVVDTQAHCEKYLLRHLHQNMKQQAAV
jgi:biopolymer transport protein ExbB/TolQ